MFSLGNVRGEAGQCRPGSATCGATFCTSSPPASEIVAGAQYRRCRLGRIAATDHLQGHLLWAYLLAGTAHARLEQDLQRLRRQAEGAAAEHASLELPGLRQHARPRHERNHEHAGGGKAGNRYRGRASLSLEPYQGMSLREIRPKTLRSLYDH